MIRVNMKVNKLERIASLFLVVVAAIWGTGFIATEYAIRADMATSLIMSIRFLVAAAVTALFSIKAIQTVDKQSLFHGIIAGVILFLAFYSQTFGQAFTNVSNSAFLTATNVVMVPFIVWAFTKERPSLKSILLSFLTLFGIGVLTFKMQRGEGIGKGDLITLFCALMFALHITYLGIYTKGIPVRVLTFLQLAVSGVLSLAVLLLFDMDRISVTALQDGIVPSLYLAIFSTCLCYFLQTKAQQYISPGRVGIILCSEGLFGSLFSVAIGLEPITVNLVIGGIIILSSILMMEIHHDKPNVNEQEIEEEYRD